MTRTLTTRHGTTLEVSDELYEKLRVIIKALASLTADELETIKRLADDVR